MTRFEELFVDTPRLTLRPPRSADAAAILELHADPEAMRYWNTPPWTTLGQARAWLERAARAAAADEALTLLLEDRAGAEILGTCSLFNWLPGCRRAEIGYMLARPAWGRGLMREALEGLLDWSFAALDLNRVEADVDPRNGASAGLLKRLGFQREGLLRQRWIVAGEISDTAFYGLLRSQWRAR